MRQKILITGATGLIGSNLTKSLVNRGESVRILVRADSDHPFLQNLPLERCVGDILDQAAVDKAMEGITHVYHCAGFISYRKKDTQRLLSVNVEGTRNILQAALRHHVQRVIHVSSVVAIDPYGPYGQSKHQSEEVCNEFARQGLDVVIARPATVYGAGDINGNSFTPFKYIQRSKFLLTPPGGKTYVHVADQVTGLRLCMLRGRAVDCYMFATTTLSFKQLFVYISQEMGVSRMLVKIPFGLKSLFQFVSQITPYSSESIPMLFEQQHVDANRKARFELGWLPQKSIRDAISEMVSFYSEHGML